MRANDWFAQARRDLEQAVQSRQAQRHEWACFAAHQSAEKAVSALHLSHGQEAWGHVVSRLLTDLPLTAAAPADLIERGRVLDTFYIPTRYPDSHPRERRSSTTAHCKARRRSPMPVRSLTRR